MGISIVALKLNVPGSSRGWPIASLSAAVRRRLHLPPLKQLTRRYIGFELDPRSADCTAPHRASNPVKKLPIFTRKRDEHASLPLLPASPTSIPADITSLDFSPLKNSTKRRENSYRKRHHTLARRSNMKLAEKMQLLASFSKSYFDRKALET